MTLLAGVGGVRHHFLRQKTLVVEKLRSDVHVGDIGNVIEQLGEIRVELDDFLSVGMVEIASAGKHAEHENFHFGIHLVEFLSDGLNSVRGLRWLVVIELPKLVQCFR